MIRRLFDRASRRGALVLIAAVAGATALALPAGGSIALPPTTSATGPNGVHVSFTQVVSGLPPLVQAVSARDGTSRLFLVEQQGEVRVETHGHLHSRVYLDVRKEVAYGGEQGLLSIAFSPNFRRNHHLYAAWTRASDGSLRVARFTASSPTATHISLSTQRNVFLVPHTQASNHNGGQLMFGAHGYLYITTGDGGDEGDTLGLAEKLTSLSAKILRIDVTRSCGHHHYCIPGSNPFAGSSNANKRTVFDWGLRNPWRASIDSKTGAMWIGDVGQDSWEEVDHVKQIGGKDFGWSCREGDHSYNKSNCTINGRPRHMTRPVHEYSHNGSGAAEIGGYDYYGPKYRFAHGIYVYADYETGRVYGLKHTSSGWQNAQIGSLSGPAGFGVADNGELYVVTGGGSAYHVVFHRG